MFGVFAKIHQFELLLRFRRAFRNCYLLSRRSNPHRSWLGVQVWDHKGRAYVSTAWSSKVESWSSRSSSTPVGSWCVIHLSKLRSNLTGWVSCCECCLWRHVCRAWCSEQCCSLGLPRCRSRLRGSLMAKRCCTFACHGQFRAGRRRILIPFESWDFLKFKIWI